LECWEQVNVLLTYFLGQGRFFNNFIDKLN
jgi:hypothetical protein